MTLAVLACQRSEGRSLERSMSEEELIGTWVMNPASVKDLRDVGYTLPIDSRSEKIIFRPDGSCTFSTITPTSVERGTPRVAADLPCRWRMGKAKPQ